MLDARKEAAMAERKHGRALSSCACGWCCWLRYSRGPRKVEEETMESWLPVISVEVDLVTAEVLWYK